MGDYIGIGRIMHRKWVEQHFAPQLVRHDLPVRDVQVDALVCTCDVYTWKLLRRDMGRSRSDAERTMAWTVKSLLGEV